MAPTSTIEKRARLLLVLTPPTVRVLNWQPLFWSIFGSSVFLAIGNPAALQTRFVVASAAVVSTSGFLLDDSAAVSLAAAPSSLALRTLHRVIVAVAPVALWWAIAAEYVMVRTSPFPVGGQLLQLVALCAIALTISVLASGIGDQTSGGIAGAVVAACFFATTFLPAQWWLPFPSSPDAGGAVERLLAIIVVATAALWSVSRDPARRRGTPFS